MLTMNASESTSQAVKRIQATEAAKISGLLFAVDPLELGDGKAAWTYDGHGMTISECVRNDAELREYLEWHRMMKAYPILSHFLGTFAENEGPWGETTDDVR